MMAEARREGLSEMHFLRGQEPYKYNWGAEDRPTFHLVLASTCSRHPGRSGARRAERSAGT
jgi:CelD/BcsL family acetyltransferase involved in cellulose biosynthesis